ncbi:MAG TPA: hypothetical protein GXZ81_05020 [Fastidiosipila sp.]|nr:hypothetical protein [Fastidiosipila sp.]
MFFSPDFNPYVAIIGDLQDSRQLEDRLQVQEKLKATLNFINESYSADIASKFTITLGDEFQGLLNNGANIMSIIAVIQHRMQPVNIRFGIGVGDVTTTINRDLAIGADGPAYYKARQAIDHLKSSSKRHGVPKADIRLEVDGKDQGTVMLLNTILVLLTTIKSSWTDRQREIIWDMLEHNDSQTAVGDRLGIKQSSVHKSLSGANFNTYREALLQVEEVLGEIRRTDV